jgi:small subunit ribosomal protein S18
MKSAKEKRPAGQKQYYRRKKVCKFCVERIDSINYKDVKLLSQFIPERAKIMPRRISGVCSPHQRQLNDAIKKARKSRCCHLRRSSGPWKSSSEKQSRILGARARW